MAIDPKGKRRLVAKLERQKKSADKASKVVDGNSVISGGLFNQTKNRKTLVSAIGNMPIVNKAILNKEGKTVGKMLKAGISEEETNAYSAEKARKRAKRGISGGAHLNF